MEIKSKSYLSLYEPGLTPEIKEKEFYKELNYAYKELEKLK